MSGRGSGSQSEKRSKGSPGELPTIAELRATLAQVLDPETLFDSLQDAIEVCDNDPGAARELIFADAAVRKRLFGAFAEDGAHIAVRELVAHLMLRALMGGSGASPAERTLLLDEGLGSFAFHSNVKVLVPACRALALCLADTPVLLQRATDEGLFDRLCSLLTVPTVHSHPRVMEAVCCAAGELMALQDNCRALAARKAFPAFLKYLADQGEAAVYGAALFSNAAAMILYYISYGGKAVQALFASSGTFGVLIQLATRHDPYADDELAEKTTLMALRALGNSTRPATSERATRDAVATHPDLSVLLDRIVIVPGMPVGDDVTAATIAIMENILPPENLEGASAAMELLGATPVQKLCRRLAVMLAGETTLVQCELSLVQAAVRRLRHLARNQQAAREVLSAVGLPGLALLARHFHLRFHSRELALYVHSLIHLCHRVADPAERVELCQVHDRVPLYRPLSVLLEQHIVSEDEARVISYTDDTLSAEGLRQHAATTVQRVWRGHRGRKSTEGLAAGRHLDRQKRQEMERDHLDSREHVLQAEFEDRQMLHREHTAGARALIQAQGRVLAARSSAEAEVDARLVLQREELVRSHEAQRAVLNGEHRQRLARLEAQQRDEAAALDAEFADVQMLGDPAERARKLDDVQRRQQRLKESHAKARIALRDMLHRERECRAVDWDEELEEADRTARRGHDFLLLGVLEERSRGLGMEGRRWWAGRGVMDEERRAWATVRTAMDLEWLPDGFFIAFTETASAESQAWLAIGDAFLSGRSHITRAALAREEWEGRRGQRVAEAEEHVLAAEECGSGALWIEEARQFGRMSVSECVLREGLLRKDEAPQALSTLEDLYERCTQTLYAMRFSERLAAFWPPWEASRGDIEAGEERERERCAQLEDKVRFSGSIMQCVRNERPERTGILADEREAWQALGRLATAAADAAALRRRLVLVEDQEKVARGDMARAFVADDTALRDRCRGLLRAMTHSSEQGGLTAREELARMELQLCEDQRHEELLFRECVALCGLSETVLRSSIELDGFAATGALHQRGRAAGKALAVRLARDEESRLRAGLALEEGVERDALTLDQAVGRALAGCATELRLAQEAECEGRGALRAAEQAARSECDAAERFEIWNARMRMCEVAEAPARAAHDPPVAKALLQLQEGWERLRVMAAQHQPRARLRQEAAAGADRARAAVAERRLGTVGASESRQRAALADRGAVARALIMQRQLLEHHRTVGVERLANVLREQDRARVGIEAAEAAAWPELAEILRDGVQRLERRRLVRECLAAAEREAAEQEGALHAMRRECLALAAAKAQRECLIAEDAAWFALAAHERASRGAGERKTLEGAEGRYRYALNIEQMGSRSSVEAEEVDVREELRQFLAARAIQCAWRSGKARREVSEMRANHLYRLQVEQEESTRSTQNEAATAVQGLYHMWRAREEARARRAERDRRRAALEAAARARQGALYGTVCTAAAALAAAVPPAVAHRTWRRLACVQSFARGRLCMDSTASRRRVTFGTDLLRRGLQAVRTRDRRLIAAGALRDWWRRRHERRERFEEAARQQLRVRDADKEMKGRRRQHCAVLLQAAARARLSVGRAARRVRRRRLAHSLIIAAHCRAYLSARERARRAALCRALLHLRTLQVCCRARRCAGVTALMRARAAARRIQSGFRRWKARDLLNALLCARWGAQYQTRLNHAAVSLQALARGRRARRRAARLRAERNRRNFYRRQAQCLAAAQALQRSGRGLMRGRRAAAARLAALKAASEPVQRWWRCVLARRAAAAARGRRRARVDALRRPIAATAIQTQWRCRAARKRVAQRRAVAARYAKRCAEAAVVLQNAGYALRERLHLARVIRPLKHSAARAVQLMYRCFAARRSAALKRAQWREKNNRARRNCCAAAIQYVYRRHYDRRKAAAYRIQRVVRINLPSLSTCRATWEQRRRLRMLDFRAMQRREAQCRLLLAGDEHDERREAARRMRAVLGVPLLAAADPGWAGLGGAVVDRTPEPPSAEWLQARAALADQESRRRRRVVREAVDGMVVAAQAEREGRKLARRAAFVARQQGAARQLVAGELGGRKAVRVEQIQRRRELRLRLAKLQRVDRLHRQALERDRAEQGAGQPSPSAEPDSEPPPLPAVPPRTPPSEAQQPLPSSPSAGAEAEPPAPHEEAPPPPRSPAHSDPGVADDPVAAPPRADSCPPTQPSGGDASSLRKWSRNMSSSLVSLDASYQGLGDVRGAALIGSLRHTARLAAVRLDGNSLGDPSAAALAEILRTNRSITSISLAHNPGVTDVGGAELVKALKGNPTLRFLDLDGTSISVAKKQMLGFLLSSNGVPPKGAPARSAPLAPAPGARGGAGPPAAEAWRSYQQALPPITPHGLAPPGDDGGDGAHDGAPRPAPWER